MPRSTSRGMRLSRLRSAEAIRVTCANCGRPFGYLAVEPSFLPLDRTEAVIWHGSEWASPELSREPPEHVPPPMSVLSMTDHRRRRRQCVRKCGAAPVYTQATLRAQYQAAKAAGQRTVRL